MTEAIFFGHRAMQPLSELQRRLRETNGVPKRVLTPSAKTPSSPCAWKSLAAAPMRAACSSPRRPGAIPPRGK